MKFKSTLIIAKDSSESIDYIKSWDLEEGCLVLGYEDGRTTIIPLRYIQSHTCIRVEE